VKIPNWLIIKTSYPPRTVGALMGVEREVDVEQLMCLAKKILTDLHYLAIKAWEEKNVDSSDIHGVIFLFKQFLDELLLPTSDIDREARDKAIEWWRQHIRIMERKEFLSLNS